jgi:hypothetical protein
MTEEKKNPVMETSEKLDSSLSTEVSEKKIDVSLPTSYHMVVSQGERPFKCHLDVPCPKQTADDISQDYEVNNWVLNHLPFRDETQRENFAKTLMLDQLKVEKEKKQRKSIPLVRQQSKLLRQNSVRTLQTSSASKKLKAKERHFPKTHGKATTEK